jgi:ornithine--oxo-acid transaminase
VKIHDLLHERRGERYALHEAHLNAQMVRVLKTIGFDVPYMEGRGAHLFDAEGHRYLDLLSGYGVFALGRNHPAVVEALRDVLSAELPDLVQMDVSLLSGVLAERLLARMPRGLEKVFFCNSGTEAVEAALKFSRAATGRSRILYCEHAFHGLTYGSLSLNGDEIFRRGFEPLLPGCDAIPFDDLDALERELRRGDVAAFVVEPIQGHGVHVPSDDYLPGAQRLCREHGALLVADEIQTGLGRTGRFLAVEHWGVEPDMVLLAKALSGGFVPVGAVATRRSVFEKVFDRMDRAVVHGSTFSKNNLAMAAGLATLDVLEREGLVEHAAELGEGLLAELAAMVPRFEFLHEVRGKGLMIGLAFGPPKRMKLRAAWKLLEKAHAGLFGQMITVPLFTRHRILSQVAGHGQPVVKFLPPLVVNEEDRRWIVSSVGDVIADSHRVPGAVWDLGRRLAGAALRMQSKRS